MTSQYPSEFHQHRPIKRSIKRGYATYTTRLWLVMFILAFLILAGTILWVALHSSDRQPSQASTSHIHNENLSISVLNPHHSGFRAGKLPFIIRATHMSQGKATPTQAILQNPEVDILLENGQWLYVKSKKATTDIERKHILMENSVSLRYDAGYEFFTDEARLNMPLETIFGNAEISGKGIAGEFHGQGFRIDNSWQNVRLLGPARLKVYGAK